MSIKPILFNTEMVCATREDRKTATRRVVKPLCASNVPSGTQFFVSPKSGVLYWGDRIDRRLLLDGKPVVSTYRPGDILWVREAWAQLSDLFDECPGYIYRADLPQCDLDELKRKKFRWRPSIHMPREAARLFLRVRDVRVERLREITIEGMRMEGVTRRGLPGGCTCAWKTETCMREPCPNRDAYEYECWVLPFIEVWDSTIRPGIRALYGWGGNPWVWVIEYERCEKPEAAS